MKKKIILLSIIIFPSLIYFFFELTQANFKKMPFFGPKTVSQKGDTVYWSVNPVNFETITRKEWKELLDKDSVEMFMDSPGSFEIDTANYPVFCIIFLDPKLKSQGFKLDGLIDYAHFKSKDLKDIPIIFVSSKYAQGEYTELTTNPDTIIGNRKIISLNGEFDSIPIKLANFIPVRLTVANRDSFLNATYFKQKPVYVFDYFMVLVDKKRHVRGYYDPSFNAEVKRMIDEYKHLKIRDEYAQTLQQNAIKQNEKK